MTEIIYYPDIDLKNRILSRPFSEDSSVEDAVKLIIADVRRNGDSALFRYARVLDGAKLETLQVSECEINESVQSVSRELKEAIAIAAENISAFHRAQSCSGG